MVVAQSDHDAWQSAPVVAHGILEVADELACPATSPSEVVQLNTFANFISRPGHVSCGLNRGARACISLGNLGKGHADLSARSYRSKHR